MGIDERKEVINRWKIDEQCRHAGPWAKEEMAEPDPGRAARTAQVDICSHVGALSLYSRPKRIPLSKKKKKEKFISLLLKNLYYLKRGKVFHHQASAPPRSPRTIPSGPSPSPTNLRHPEAAP
jgi:hypothetical protein